MASAPEMVDFFVSRRGGHEEVAHEVAKVLRDAGHSVLMQDSDILASHNFVEAMHYMVTHCRNFHRDSDQGLR